jgi:hypothetical protein
VLPDNPVELASMPKVTVNKYCDPFPRKSDIGIPDHPGVVPLEVNAALAQIPKDQKLGLRVLRPDARHQVRAVAGISY